MARIRLVALTFLLFVLGFALYTIFCSRPLSTIQRLADYGAAYNVPGALSFPKSHGGGAGKPFISQGTTSLIPRKPRFAITSSIQTSSYTPMALMLAYSILKYNDLQAMDAELVLLIRDEGENAVTPENRAYLEKVGWKIIITQDLVFKGVDNSKIRSHHRHNLNKLVLWKWTNYEKILFIDADMVCKGSLAELFQMPGDFAAAPDVWWDILHDSRFNSGTIVFRPSTETFHDMISKMSDQHYHRPNDADQAFLNAYYEFRFFMLPFKYNFNLIMYQFHRKVWDMLWDEAVLIHFTVHKPNGDPKKHCHKNCNEWEPMEWYGQNFREMLAYHGWENELPVYA